MRFDLPESIQAMREGRKVQTRRRSDYFYGKEGYDAIIVHDGARLGRLRIKETWKQPLYTMTDEDAWAEGYDSLEKFLGAFFELYHWKDWREMIGTTVTVIEFDDIRWKRGGDA